MQENSHCRSHRAQSAVGICAICLKEKLGKLAFCPEPPEVGSPSPSSDFTRRNADVGSVGRISFLIDKDRSNHPGPSNGFVLFGRSKSVASPAIGSLEDLSRRPSKTASKKKASFWSFLYLRKKSANRSSENPTPGAREESSLPLGPKVTRSRSVGYGGRPLGFSDSAPRASDRHQKAKMEGDEEEQVKTNVKCGRLFVGFGGVPSSSSSAATPMISYDLKNESARRTRMGIF